MSSKKASDSITLRTIMSIRFACAKRSLWWSGAIGITIGLFAILVALTPQSYLGVAWWTGVISTLLLAVQFLLQRHARSQLGIAEKIRQAFLLRDGLGQQVPSSFFETIKSEHSHLVEDTNPYFTSELPCGPIRLVMATWESAYWTEQLQKIYGVKILRRALALLIVAIAAILAVMRGDESGAAAQVVPPILALVVGLNLWGRWRDIEQLTRACVDVGKDAENLVRYASTTSKQPSTAELAGLLMRYSAVVTFAHPAPDSLYNKNKYRLDAAWEGIVNRTHTVDLVTNS